jgi:uncharacterized membrane protein
VIARGYLWTLLALGLTVYGQLIVKWRIDLASDRSSGESRGHFWLHVLIDPWIISSFVFAALAALAYFAALTTLEVSRAYPVMALSFAIVVIASAPLYGEALTIPKVLGVCLITVGVVVATRV